MRKISTGSAKDSKVSSKRQSRIRALLGVLISIAFLCLALLRVEFDAVWHSLTQVNYLYFLPVMALSLLAFCIRAYRWKFLLNSIKPVGISNLLSATMIGFMANYLLPVRLGEVVRAYVIGRKEDISKSASFATIFVERIFDGLTLLLFFLFLLIFLQIPSWLKKAASLSLMVYLVALIFIYLLRKNTAFVTRVISSFLRILPWKIDDRVQSLITHFGEGLGILGNGKHFAVVAVLSLIMWTVLAIGISIAYIPFNLGLPLHSAFLVLSVVSIGIMIPSSPGYIGTFQYFCVASLSVFNVDKSTALSFALVYHACDFALIVLSGLYFLSRENISLLRIRELKVAE